MKTKNVVYAILFVTALFAYSCSKDGPAGPQGEQGVAGEAGPRGATGAKGDKGDQGTANVVASTWFLFEANEINTSVKRMSYTIPQRFFDQINYSDFNSFMTAGGVILIYGDNLGQDPRLFSYEYKNARYTAGSAYNNTKLLIDIIGINDSNDGSLRNFRIRYILIAPGAELQARKSTRPKFNDYHAVCEYYGIPEL